MDIKNCLTDPKINYAENYSDLNFADYINKTKKMMAKFQPDATIVNTNAPFEYRPTGTPKAGALLIHGLFDTPFIMQDIGKTLQSAGLLVRSILLPGHGSVPGALLNVQYEEWIAAARYGLNSLKSEVESIYLVGFSTGAMLNLYLTLDNPEKIAGLILLCPAYKINTTFDFALNWHKPISGFWPRAQWFAVCEEVDSTKYLSVPLNAAYQVHRLAQAIEKINHTRTPPCPCLMVLTEQDEIVDSHEALKTFNTYKNEKNKVILYTNKDTHSPNNKIIVRKSVYPQWNINSFSHISIPISTKNLHYGENGNYPLASHVNGKTNSIYGAYTPGRILLLNFLYKIGVLRQKRERLTFNPDFEFMAEEIANFCK